MHPKRKPSCGDEGFQSPDRSQPTEVTSSHYKILLPVGQVFLPTNLEGGINAPTINRNEMLGEWPDIKLVPKRKGITNGN
jgi:hypothetical protein